MTKQIIYYTDNRLDPGIASRVRQNIRNIADSQGMEIVCSSLEPMAFGDVNVNHPKLSRGILTLFKQQLGAVRASSADVLFFCEHDVLYHPSHFEFTPTEVDAYYYNLNVWRVRMSDGHSLRVNGLRQTSGLCGYRSRLLEHYTKRLEIVEKRRKEIIENGWEMVNDGVSKYMAYEPGCHMKPRGVDDYPVVTWTSELPNLDLRHNGNLTKSRWKKEEYRDPHFADGWTESMDIPGWGRLYDFWYNLPT